MLPFVVYSDLFHRAGKRCWSKSESKVLTEKPLSCTIQNSPRFLIIKSLELLGYKQHSSSKRFNNLWETLLSCLFAIQAKTIMDLVQANTWLNLTVHIKHLIWATVNTDGIHWWKYPPKHLVGEVDWKQWQNGYINNPVLWWMLRPFTSSRRITKNKRITGCELMALQ